MTKYERVFRWEVLDKIREKKRVYLIDRLLVNDTRAIQSLNDMETQRVCELLDYDNDDNRYDFFTMEAVADEK
jgi:hypothetical protein